ncbi:MAG TPA: ATP-binding protein, partial [Pyrinomonadaceae bacterium]|nr:ATP-binding protein [Pyrinomonadaceae bacterium]
MSQLISERNVTWSPLYRYGLAVLTVVVALAIKLIFLQFKVTFPLSSSFLAAIAISFWFGGTGPGVVAVVLSSIAFGYIVVPYQVAIFGGAARDGFAGRILTAFPYLVYFGLVALLMSWFSSSRRKAERMLNQARSDLGLKVEERTADLLKANVVLQAEIAERKRVEATLSERASLLDLTHDSVFVRDMNDVIKYWNRGAEEQYRWTMAEAVGRVSHEIAKTVFPIPLPEINEILRLTGRWEGELTHFRRDGSAIVVASRWALQRDEQGNSLAILETNNDITERRRAEDDLQKARAKLTQASRVMSMGELVASIAHEVNQPLGAIVTNGQACVRLLSREPPDVEKSRAVVDRMIKDGMRASEVIKRIRSLLNKTPPQKQQLQINEIVREVIALVKTDLVRSNIVLVTDLADDLPGVEADRIQIQQVILNLILNGRDAMVDQTGKHELLISSSLGEADDLTVSVADSGSGFDEENVEKIFDPFYSTKPDG